MKKILLKYKDIKLLVNEDVDIQHFIDNKELIVQLHDAMNQFTTNLLNQSDDDAKKIDELKQKLAEFVMHSDVIGFPFHMKDAELYALDNNIEYEILEIND